MEMDGAGQGPDQDIQADIEQPSEPLLLDVLKTVKAAQLQHGLRHEDYERYRKYCARKLHRLYKANKMTHGRGKYMKRTLDVNHVTESGHLLVLLISAERAWAHAMQLKGGMDTGDGVANRQRHHSIRRLAKAANWAGVMAAASSAKGDPRTTLEATAYADWLAGVCFVERKQWTRATSKLGRAEAILRVLAGTGSLEAQELAQQKLSEVEQQLRFAQYEAGRRGGDTNAADGMEGIVEDESWRKLTQQLDTGVVAPVGKASQLSFITWQGQTFPVTLDRVKASLQAALEAEAVLEGLGPHAENVSELAAKARAAADRAVAAFNDAKGYIRHALNTSAGGGKDGDGSASTELRSLNVAVTGRQLERTLQRSLAMIAAAEARLPPGLCPRASHTAQESVEKASRAEDLVRLYDSLMGSVRELGDVATQLGGAAGEQLVEECAARAAQARAMRCFYVAHAYLAAGRARDAYAVFERVGVRAAEARERYEDCAHPDPAALSSLDELEERAQAWRGVAHAEVVAEEQRASANTSDRLKGLQLSDAEGPEVAYLLDSLGEWASFAGATGHRRICALPPRPSPVPVRPFMLDAALGYIQQPPLEHRGQKEEAKSTFSKLASFWRK